MKKYPEKLKIIGKILKTRRMELGYTVIDLAEQAEISPGYINEIENAKRPNFSLNTFIAITSALKIDPIYVFTIVKYPNLFLREETTKVSQKSNATEDNDDQSNSTKKPDENSPE